MDYNFQDVIANIARGGAALALAYGLASLVGDLSESRIRMETILNVVIAAILFWLTWNYDLATVLYGWILLAEILFAGFMAARHHHKK
jgi:hypothetical protein